MSMLAAPVGIKRAHRGPPFGPCGSEPLNIAKAPWDGTQTVTNRTVCLILAKPTMSTAGLAP
ncbi:hypothetical protein HJFPF1_01213 [Paramyrothecium foliicola]|nr:hypothetical protein HJFPF1_01213 [Paramyrothecium foliicola]